MAPRALRRTGNHTVDLWINARRFGAVRGASESAVGLSGDSVQLLPSRDAPVCRPSALWPCCDRANKVRRDAKVANGGEGYQRRQWLTWRHTVQKRGTPPAHPAPCCLHSGTPVPTCREMKGEDSLCRTHPKNNLDRLYPKDKQVAFYCFSKRSCHSSTRKVFF